MNLQWKKEEHECSRKGGKIRELEEVDVVDRLDSQGKSSVTHQPRVLSHTL